LLASFAPFVLLRFAPIIEGAAISQLEGVSRRPVNAARAAAGRAANAPSTALGALLAGHGTSSSAEAAPAAKAVEGVGLAATGGQVDREFALAGVRSPAGGSGGERPMSGASGTDASATSGGSSSGVGAAQASGGPGPVGSGASGGSGSGRPALQSGLAQSGVEQSGGSASGGPGADHD